MVYLVGDIGGTHARFALADDTGGLHHPEVFRAADYSSLQHALRHYLTTHQAEIGVAALSVAATLLPGEDAVTLVNHPAWNFSAAGLKADMGLSDLLLLNDFAALAHAIPALQPGDLQTIAPGTPVDGGPIGVIGPGTGLGMAGILFIDGQAHVIASEGGNASLPLPDAAGAALIQSIRNAEGRHFISAEDILSGPGLLRLYRAVVKEAGIAPALAEAAAVSDAALAGRCPAASHALDLFCQWLGVVAGDLALTLQTSGGIYIAGGIIPQWGKGFRADLFLRGFTDKGPYADFMQNIPVFVVTHPFPALAGLQCVMSHRTSRMQVI